jgi:hypothetical protein
LNVQKRITSVKSGISKASGAQADILYAPGDAIRFGSQTLQVLPTPGERQIQCHAQQGAQLGAVPRGQFLLLLQWSACGAGGAQGIVA